MRKLQKSVPLSHFLVAGTVGQSGVLYLPSITSPRKATHYREVDTGNIGASASARLLAGSKPCFRFTQTPCPAGLKVAHEVHHAAA